MIVKGDYQKTQDKSGSKCEQSSERLPYPCVTSWGEFKRKTVGGMGRARRWSRISGPFPWLSCLDSADLWVNTRVPVSILLWFLN